MRQEQGRNDTVEEQRVAHREVAIRSLHPSDYKETSLLGAEGDESNPMLKMMGAKKKP